MCPIIPTDAIFLTKTGPHTQHLVPPTTNSTTTIPNLYLFVLAILNINVYPSVFVGMEGRGKKKGDGVGGWGLGKLFLLSNVDVES